MARVVSGDQKLKRRLQTLQAALPTLMSQERLGAFLVRRMQVRFGQRVDPEMKPWRERSSASRGSHPLLEETGNMRRAIAVLDRGQGSGFGVSTGAGFRIGVLSRNVTNGRGKQVDTADYARVHQRGNKRVPMRRFLGIGALDIKAVDSLMRREISKLLGN